MLEEVGNMKNREVYTGKFVSNGCTVGKIS